MFGGMLHTLQELNQDPLHLSPFGVLQHTLVSRFAESHFPNLCLPLSSFRIGPSLPLCSCQPSVETRDRRDSRVSTGIKHPLSATVPRAKVC